MNNYLKYVFLFFYLADVVNTIIAIHLDNRKYYAVTKSLLMPLLLATYLCFLPEILLHADYQKFAIWALTLHAVGDILLLFPKDKTKLYFFIGAFSFFLGHICYIFWFAQPKWGHGTAGIIAAGLAALGIEIFFVQDMLKGNRKLAIPFILYSLSLSVLFVSVFSTLACKVTIGITLLATVGVGIFWFSDFSIARREMHMKTWGQMVTMTTYMAAQTILSVSMLLFQGVL